MEVRQSDRPDMTRDLSADGEICRESADGSYRYLLGRPSTGGKNVIVVGVNPSKAGLGRSDRTMEIVIKTCECLGWDGYMMVNLYPLRCGNPADLPREAAPRAVEENARALRGLASSSMRHADVWAAWGDAILTRPYLVEGLRQIVTAFAEAGNDSMWFSMGPLTAAGNPRHPYQRTEAMRPYHFQPEQFDVEGYLSRIG